MKMNELKPGDIAIIISAPAYMNHIINRVIVICSNFDRTKPYCQMIGVNDGWDNWQDLDKIEVMIITEQILEGVKNAT